MKCSVLARKSRRWRLPVALILSVIVGLSAVSVAWALGELTQKAGRAGCISETGSSGQCEDGKALHNALDAAVSPDGKNVYVASGLPGSVAVFDRNPKTSALSQKPGQAACISNNGSGGECVDGRGLLEAEALIVSGDGKSVYVASHGLGMLAVFDRNPQTGALIQKGGEAGCIASVEVDGCERGRGLDGNTGLAESPDGEYVYGAGWFADAITAFKRDPATGTLTQLQGNAGCISETGSGGQCEVGRALGHTSATVVSPDGNNVYVASHASDAIAAFKRDPATGVLTQLPGKAGCIDEDGTLDDDGIDDGCEKGRLLDGSVSLAISPDGKNVYATSHRDEAVLIFDRDPQTGALAQKPGKGGCITERPVAGCVDGRDSGDDEILVSPDGSTVYVTAEVSSAVGNGAVAIFDRDPSTGVLTQRPGKAGCVSQSGSHGDCGQGKALEVAFGIAMSSDGESVYVASAASDAVAIFDRGPRPGEPPPGKGPPRDTVSPRVAGFRLAPARFKVTAKRRPSFRFTLSEKAGTRIEIERGLPGRRSGKLCKRPTPELAKHPPCKRFTHRANLDFPGRPSGANTITFNGKIGARKLAPGSYRATIVATDPAGNSSAPQRASFTVLAPRRRSR